MKELIENLPLIWLLAGMLVITIIIIYVIFTIVKAILSEFYEFIKSWFK
jgi:hypothetical protein